MTNITRPISVVWTASTDLTTTGYNVYLCNGSPQANTKTLLSFVSGIATTSYLYNGIEGNQYQFEIRAWNGTTESLPQYYFYPTGTSIYTPTDLTPDNYPMKVVRDSQYLSKDDYIKYPNGLKLTTSSALYTNGVLDMILQMASEEVNRFTRRHFDVQTIDEVYDGIHIGADAPKLMTVPLNEGPIQNVGQITIQVLKWFIPFSLDYLQVFPDKGFYQMVPFLGAYGSGSPIPAALLSEGLLGKIWTRYTFGYDTLPMAVKMATSLFATNMIGMQENPVGANKVSIGHFSYSWDVDKNPLMEKGYQLLRPYRLATWRRP